MQEIRNEGSARARLGRKPALCSGKLSASSLVYEGHVILASVIVKTDGINDATAVVYDSTSAAGKIVREFKVKAEENFGGNALNFPIYLENGLYVSLTGAGASYIIDYIEYTEPKL